MQHRRNVGDDIDASQAPYHLIVDEADRNAMCCDDQILTRNQINCTEDSTDFSDIVSVWYLIRLDCGVNKKVVSLINLLDLEQFVMMSLERGKNPFARKLP